MHTLYVKFVFCNDFCINNMLCLSS